MAVARSTSIRQAYSTATSTVSLGAYYKQIVLWNDSTSDTNVHVALDATATTNDALLVHGVCPLSVTGLHHGGITTIYLKGSGTAGSGTINVLAFGETAA